MPRLGSKYKKYKYDSDVLLPLSTYYYQKNKYLAKHSIVNNLNKNFPKQNEQTMTNNKVHISSNFRERKTEKTFFCQFI